jgi:hypothetical protein
MAWHRARRKCSLTSIAIWDVPWFRRPPDKHSGDRDTLYSRERNGPRASSAGLRRCLHAGQIGPRGSVGLPLRDSSFGLDWGRSPALPLGIRVAGDPTVAAVFRPSSSSVIMAHLTQGLSANLSWKVFFDPSFKTFPWCFGRSVSEFLSDFLPRVPLAQHFEVLPDVVPIRFVDPALDLGD